MAKPVIINTDSGSPVFSLPRKSFWGSIPQLVRDPLSMMKKVASQGEDIVELPMPFSDASVIVDPDIAHQILVKQIKHFKKGDRDINNIASFLGKGLVTLNQFDTHKTQRKLVQPGFHFRRLEAYGETMINYTDAYTKDWQGDEVRDIADDMFQLTMYIVSKTLFDTDMENMQDQATEIGLAIQDAQNAVNERFFQVIIWPDWMPTPRNLRIKKARKQVMKTIEGMIAPRALPNGEYEDHGDLLSMLLSAKYDDGSCMSKRQIMDELITLFAAGHETTSNALAWTFYLLAKHPEIQQKLQAELDMVIEGDKPEFADLNNLVYTEMVFKEAMRLFPPVWTLSTRQATEDITLGKYAFPKGKQIFISPYVQHYNAKIFPNPETFDPERFNETNEKQLPRHAFLPFGAGGRVCIGNSFAMMEGKLILASMLKRFSFALSENLKIQPEPLITLSNKGGMPLKVTARKPAHNTLHPGTRSLTEPSPQGDQLEQKQYA